MGNFIVKSGDVYKVGTGNAGFIILHMDSNVPHPKTAMVNNIIFEEDSLNERVLNLYSNFNGEINLEFTNNGNASVTVIPSFTQMDLDEAMSYQYVGTITDESMIEYISLLNSLMFGSNIKKEKLNNIIDGTIANRVVHIRSKRNQWVDPDIRREFLEYLNANGREATRKKYNLSINGLNYAIRRCKEFKDE